MSQTQRINSGNFIDLLNKVFSFAKQGFTLSTNPYHGLRFGLYKEITMVHKTHREAVSDIEIPAGVEIHYLGTVAKIVAYSQEKVIPAVVFLVQKGYDKGLAYKHVGGEYSVALLSEEVVIADNNAPEASEAPVKPQERVLEATPSEGMGENENASESDTDGSTAVAIAEPKPKKSRGKKSKQTNIELSESDSKSND